MRKPFIRQEEEDAPPKKKLELLGNGKGEYYTGNKTKDLLVHITQNMTEIDKPIKAKIYQQSIEWNQRQWPIIPKRFIYDYHGIAHQYVDVNDVAVLTMHKDHEDHCKKCGGKMTVDAKESRALGRKGIFTAIWGVDNTRMIMLIILFVGAVALAGAFMWAFNDASIAKVKLENAGKEITRLNNIINPPPPEPEGNNK